jgi:hypothetical protein
MAKGFLALLLLVFGGCRSQPTNELAKNELDNKPEYSILQAFEYQYREVKNDKSYLVFKNALKSDATVVAFPIKSKATGYVVLLAQTKSLPKVKAMPDADFVVTKDALEQVRAATPLSKEVEQFITAHVRESAGK